MILRFPSLRFRLDFHKALARKWVVADSFTEHLLSACHMLQIGFLRGSKGGQVMGIQLQGEEGLEVTRDLMSVCLGDFATPDKVGVQ